MTRYLAHISATGPIRYGQYPFAIGVLEGPDPSPAGSFGCERWACKHANAPGLPLRGIFVGRMEPRGLKPLWSRAGAWPLLTSSMERRMMSSTMTLKLIRMTQGRLN
jgi:hypothetical protein